MKNLNKILMMTLFVMTSSVFIEAGPKTAEAKKTAVSDKAYSGTYKNGAKGSFNIILTSDNSIGRKKVGKQGGVWKNTTDFAIDMTYKTGTKKSAKVAGAKLLLPGKSFTMPGRVWSAKIIRHVA